MKISSRISLIAAFGGLLASPFALLQAADKEPAQKSASAEYPLKTCVVSGEELGSMGAPVEYVHKEAGKSDRVVKFCCKGCTKDFVKEPAKYLKQLDEAAAKAEKKK